MADYRKMIPFLLKWEGGFSNDPSDSGGATMKGVTLDTFRNYRREKGFSETTADDLKRITAVQWEEIFKQHYWDRWQGDRIVSQPVAELLVDWVWCSGVWGIRIPQRVLALPEDGVVGERTLAVLNAREPEELFVQLKQAREQYIDDICRRRLANERFRRGWMNRLTALKYAMILPLILLVCGCTPRQVFVPVRQTTMIVDTVVQVRRDSADIVALIECDSNRRAVIRHYEQRVSASGESDLIVDSNRLRVITRWKTNVLERRITVRDTVAVVQRVEVERVRKVVPKLYRWCFWIVLLMAGWWAVKLFLRMKPL